MGSINRVLSEPDQWGLGQVDCGYAQSAPPMGYD